MSKWHISAFNSLKVIQVCEGDSPDGKKYIDDRHTMDIADISQEYKTLEQAEENAELIAAAPEMFLALQRISQLNDHNFKLKDAIDIAKECLSGVFT